MSVLIFFALSIITLCISQSVTDGGLVYWLSLISSIFFACIAMGSLNSRTDIDISEYVVRE